MVLLGLSDKSLRYTSTANRESQLENPDSASWEHFRMEPSLPGWGILHQGNFRKKFFTERVVRLWHRLPRAELESPTLEVFKNEAFGDMV